MRDLEQVVVISHQMGCATIERAEHEGDVIRIGWVAPEVEELDLDHLAEHTERTHQSAHIGFVDSMLPRLYL